MSTTANPTRFFQTCLGVFQGGGCRGAAFVGALSEAKRRGVGFAAVAGTSAGSIVAALLGAGADMGCLESVLGGLDFTRFLLPPETASSFATFVLPDTVRIWMYHGLHSSRGIEEWMNEQLSRLLPGTRRVKFRDLPVPTYVVAADIISNDVKVWSSVSTPEDEVAQAVRCSCSIPGFFQPVYGQYIDGGVLSNLPAFVFSGGGPFANRILAFSLRAALSGEPPTTGRQLFSAVVSTVVDGASAMQGRLVPNVHEIAIETGNIRATDFDKINQEKVGWLFEQGKAAAREFFDDELSHVQATQTSGDLLSGTDEVYSALTESLDDPRIEHVVISDEQTKWAYSIFPTLLAWCTRGARIQVVLSRDGRSPHEMYRRRLLRALGAEISFAPSAPFRGFLLNPTDGTLARAIVALPETPGVQDASVRYRAPVDICAIEALSAALASVAAAAPNRLNVNPKLRLVSEHAIIEKLKRYVPAYAGQSRLSVETVPLESVVSMTRVVKGYKFKQIQQLFDLFRGEGLSHFQPAEVHYAEGQSTFVTPPVAEFSGKHYILVQGNTRALYCHKSGMSEMRCIVVRSPIKALPSRQQIPLKHVLIGDRTISTADRYGGEIDKDYRSIEFATHHPEETLLDVQV